MSSFPWPHHLDTNSNWQGKTITDTFLNILTNFIPNETKIFVPRDPSWITKPFITMLNMRNRLLNNYTKHDYKAEGKDRLEGFRIECQQAVNTTKLSH